MNEFKIVLKMPAYYDITCSEDIISYIKAKNLMYDYYFEDDKTFNIFDVVINSNYYKHNNILMRPAFCTFCSPNKVLYYILQNDVKLSKTGLDEFLKNHTKLTYEDKNIKSEQDKLKFINLYCR